MLLFILKGKESKR